VQDSDVIVTTNQYLEVIYAYRITPFLMTLSDLQGHLPIASFLKAIFCRVMQCAAVGEISTDI